MAAGFAQIFFRGVNRRRELRFHAAVAVWATLSMACRNDHTGLFVHVRSAHFAGVSAIARRSGARAADACPLGGSSLLEAERALLPIARIAPWCIRFLNAEAVFFFLL
jgi:hypothetical protein